MAIVYLKRDSGNKPGADRGVWPLLTQNNVQIIIELDKVAFRQSKLGGKRIEYSDAELFERLQRDEEEAMEALIVKYRTGLTWFAFNILHDMDEAEDVMMDAFACLAASRSRFMGKSTVKTYLYAIAKNQAFKRLKKRRVRSYDPEALSRCPGWADASPSAEEEAICREDHELLFHAMQGLQADYRQALYLVCMDGMSYREAGEVMGKRPEQVNHLVSRGKQALKSLLREE